MSSDILNKAGLVRLELLTYSMEQNPTVESNRFSASQVIPRVLWN